LVDVQTVGLFLLAVSIVYMCGYGLVTLLLPSEYDEYRFIIMPPVGYTVFVWAAYTLSGTLQIATGRSCVFVFIALAVLSVASYLWRRPANEARKAASGLRKSFLLSLTLMVIVLWPMFHVGADTFLGAVNPDYFASLIDNNFLRDNPITSRSSLYESYHPVMSIEGRLPISARFGATVLPILFEELLGIPARTAMTIAISLFLTCLPLSVYFMARVVLRFRERAAVFASILTGISGCVTMSYVYFYVGQNSGIGSLPMVIATMYIMVTRPSIRVTILAALLASSFFTMYMGMLAYALAPIGVLGLYMLITREMSIGRGLFLVGTFFATLTIVNLGMLGHVALGFAGWRDLVGLSLQGQFFLDFLTEQYLPIFVGLSNYPILTSYVSQWMGLSMVPLLTVLSVLMLIVMGVFSWRWAREMEHRHVVVMMIGGVLIYATVWFIYTYFRQYGYAVFKMSSWLQFVQVLPWAYGVDRLLWRDGQITAHRERTVRRVSLVILLVVLVGGNLLSSFRLTNFSLGQSPQLGYIVNHYDVSGNDDYFELSENLRTIVGPEQSIGLGFTDVIQNSWVYYYLQDFRVSVLSHYVFPSDDENLPDIKTRLVTDYYGNVGPDYNQFFHGATDDYYLTQTDATINQEIVEQNLPKPEWSNRTFQLLRAEDTPGFLVTGRGFYRIEYFPFSDVRRQQRSYWWPEKYRWSAEGGEVYMLRADPKVAKQVSFLGIVGYGLSSSSRTVELWLNGEKFDEVDVHETARVLSRPFYPSGNVDLVVIKIKEKVRPPARRFRLWNLDIPGDYRMLNMAMAQIKIADVEEARSPGPAVLKGEDLFLESLAFNGINLNQWVGETMSITMAPPVAYDHIRISSFVPGHPELNFPVKLTIDCAGEEYTRSIAEPGTIEVTLPAPKVSLSGEVKISMNLDQWYVPAGTDTAYRATRESFRLEAIAFE
jgi:hypothetical protein